MDDRGPESGPAASASASPGKAPGAFRTISEAAEAIGVPQHVLRFWETRFPQLKPLKRGGNRRYYRPEDMTLLETIRAMLHDQGLTIRGAQLALASRPKAGGARATVVSSEVRPAAGAEPAAPDVVALRAIRERLAAALA